MDINEFLLLSPELQTANAYFAIRKSIKPDRQLDCEMAIYAELQLFNHFAYQVKRLRGAGVTFYGARGIFEYLRFETHVSGKEETFKLNNNLPPLFARIALALFEDLHINGEPFFQCRDRDSIATPKISAAFEEHQLPLPLSQT